MEFFLTHPLTFHLTFVLPSEILGIMEEKTKIRLLEKFLGGPVAAAKAAGVQYVTWYRWRNGLRGITPQTSRMLDMMLKELSSK